MIFIYLAEAHADDVWPHGFGINSTKTKEERFSRCKDLFLKHPDLKKHLDAIFVDNMNDDFNNLTGAWPESYFFADQWG